SSVAPADCEPERQQRRSDRACPALPDALRATVSLDREVLQRLCDEPSVDGLAQVRLVEETLEAAVPLERVTPHVPLHLEAVLRAMLDIVRRVHPEEERTARPDDTSDLPEHVARRLASEVVEGKRGHHDIKHAI